jgi:hypothetical protein
VAPQFLRKPPVVVEDRSGVSDAREFSPSAARNCGPIRDVLTRVLPDRGNVLEIGSVVPAGGYRR